MPNVVYTWNAGSCGSFDDTTVRNPFYTAPSSACTGTISVHASQGGSPQVPAVKVSALPAAPPAAPPATEPDVIPDIVPTGLTSDDVAVILPSSGGTFSVPQEAGDTTPAISLEVPGGALDSGTAAAVTINVVSQGSVAGPPPAATEGSSSGTFAFGSTVIEVKWYDDGGNTLDTKTLNKPAKICVPYVQADVDAAADAHDGLSVWRYNGTVWVKLNSTVNVIDGTVCAYTSRFSVFALSDSMLPAPEASSAPSGLPATGGYTPNALTLLLAALAGVGLIVIGVVAIKSARVARPTL